MNKEMKWFGVKTAYLSKVKGKPINPDKLYDSNSYLLEERVIIIKAINADEAILKGDKEAQIYSKHASYKNVYGQRVFTTYLKICVVFELFEAPKNFSEVYSATRVIRGTTNVEVLKNMLFGNKENRSDLQKRNKFLNAELSKNISPTLKSSGERRGHTQ